MSTFWNEDVKLKLRYYLVPQALVILFISFYPLYINDLFAWLYKISYWDFFSEIASNQVWVIGLFTVVLAYFAYAKKGISLFNYGAKNKKWLGRIYYFALPLFLGCLCMKQVQRHLDHAKIRHYTISNINEIKNLQDSVEVYTIENYNILYDEYFYTEGVEDINIGTSKHQHYVTEAYAYVVCPVLANFSTEFDLKKQKVWIGFYISKVFEDVYNHASMVVKEAAYENITKLHAQDNIIYFTETQDETYKNLIKGKLENNSTPDTETIVLEAQYTPYVPYDSHEYLLAALYIFLGGNVVIIFASLIVGMDEEEKKRLLLSSM